MAKVNVQTAAALPGPGQTPAVSPSAMPSAGTLSLQTTVNGSSPAPSSEDLGPAADPVDCGMSDNPPGSLLENMANTKEKTPMCLVNELARFNRLQPQYKLLNERGPAHAKIFIVQLALGEQTWEAEGTSIKKAQHSTASKALMETSLPRPIPRPPKLDNNSNPGSVTPTVELNGLAMKRGTPAVYRPLDPSPTPNHRANYNFRGMINQRYHCPTPKIFYVQLLVGSGEFIGEGRTRQAARHHAATKALQVLRDLPIPDSPPQGPEVKEESADASKSEISLVYEIALKRNLPVNFEVLKESGPPHMKSFLTRVTVGEFWAQGEGNSKKLSKKRAALSILQELKKLPFIAPLEKPRLHFKKRPKTLLKTGPEYGQGMNPISRLAQIQQAEKEKEPEYLLLSERGLPRRREFVMQVTVGSKVTTGTGPNKKVSKRNAAEAMLLLLGYRATIATPSPPGVLTDNKGWNGQSVALAEPPSNTPKGILHLSPDVYQEMEASRAKGGFPGPGITAAIARELLRSGTSPTAEALGPQGRAPAQPCTSVQPAQQLEYLARIQGFQAQYRDRQDGRECVTYLTLSPVQMTFHGVGCSVQASHDQAAMCALKRLSEQGLDLTEGPVAMANDCEEPPLEQPGQKMDRKQPYVGTGCTHNCQDLKAVV